MNTNLPCRIIECQHQLDIHPTQKNDLKVRRIFLTKHNSCVAHIQNIKQLKYNLVHCHHNSQAKWYTLRSKSAIEQLDHERFIVLYLNDCSVELLTLTLNSLKNEVVRKPQNIFFDDFRSSLYLFSESQSFCVAEQYMKSNRKLTYFRLVGKQFKPVEELMVQFGSKKLLKLNQKSKIGWISTYQQSKNNIFHPQNLGNRQNQQPFRPSLTIIDLANPDNMMEKIAIPKPKVDGKPMFLQFKILHLTEIDEKKYICLCSAKQGPILQFWILDLNRLYDSRCMQRLIPSNENLRYFGQYSEYNFRRFGPFIVSRDQYNDIEIIDPERKIVIGLTFQSEFHNQKICTHSYRTSILANERGYSLKILLQFNLKAMLMHMLLHLNEDFDDDLLQDAIEMIE